MVRLLHAPEQVYFLVNVQYHADGIDAPSLHGQQGVLTDNKKGRDGCVCVDGCREKGHERKDVLYSQHLG